MPETVVGITTQDPHLAPGDFDADGFEDLALGDADDVHLLKSDGKSFKKADGDPLGAKFPGKRCLPVGPRSGR